MVDMIMLKQARTRRGKPSTIVALALCFLLTSGALAQSPKDLYASESAKLEGLERMWNQAQLSRDVAAIASMIGDKFINTEYDGEVSDRKKFLADFKDPEYQPAIMNIGEMKVELYANTAIVAGSYHTKGSYGTKPYEHFGRFTDTWVFQEGKWVCVASHTSLLKK